MRTPPEKPRFTFSDGTEITIERVGPMIVAEIIAENPEPRPPLAPGFDGAMEPNPADPDYAADLAAHNMRISMLVANAYIDLGTSDDVEVDPAAVARVRAYQARRGHPIDDVTDKVVYIKYCLMQSQEDIETLVLRIANYDHPAEGMIEASIDSFHGDVPRDGSENDPPTTFRRAVQLHTGGDPRGEVGEL